MEDKYFFNNCWYVSHPTIDFFAFDAYCVEAFGHKCIVEHVQDGEIWSDNEYYGTMFYDFEKDRYAFISYYLDDGKEIERILKNWMNYEENPDDIWTGKISEDFVNNKELSSDKTKLAVNFYKSYLESETNTDIENYYKLMSKNINYGIR